MILLNERHKSLPPRGLLSVWDFGDVVWYEYGGGSGDVVWYEYGGGGGDVVAPPTWWGLVRVWPPTCHPAPPPAAQQFGEIRPGGQWSLCSDHVVITSQDRTLQTFYTMWPRPSDKSFSWSWVSWSDLSWSPSHPAPSLISSQSSAYGRW